MTIWLIGLIVGSVAATLFVFGIVLPWLNTTKGGRDLLDSLAWMGNALRSIQLWQWLLALMVAGAVIEAPPVVLVALFLMGAALYLRAWSRDFLFLMSLRDDDFPGRFDKPVWAFVLIALGPVGYWLFRGYRLVHWPSAFTDEAHSPRAKPAPAPDLL